MNEEKISASHTSFFVVTQLIFVSEQVLYYDHAH